MLNWASRADATPAARHVRLVSNCIGIQDQHASRNPAILHLPFRVVVGVRCRSTNVARGCLRHTGNVQLSGQSHTVKQFAQTHRHARGVWTWVSAHAKLTVTSTDKMFRLETIDCDRCRKARQPLQSRGSSYGLCLW
jgi:hypothetical protein